MKCCTRGSSTVLVLACMLLAACGGSSDEQALRDRVEQLEAALGSSSLATENPPTTDAPTTTVATTTTTSTTTTVAPTTTNVRHDTEFWATTCQALQGLMNSWVRATHAWNSAQDRDSAKAQYFGVADLATAIGNKYGPTAARSTLDSQRNLQSHLSNLADYLNLWPTVDQVDDASYDRMAEAYWAFGDSCEPHGLFPLYCLSNENLDLLHGSRDDAIALEDECREESTTTTTTVVPTTTTVVPTTTPVVPTTTNVSRDEEFWEAACTGVQAALNGWMKGNDATYKSNDDVPGYDRDLIDYLFGEAAWTAELHADLWGPRALHSSRPIQQQYQANMLILADAFTLMERNRFDELDDEALNAAWIDLQSACRWHDFYPVPCRNNLDLPLFKGSWFDYAELETECREDS